MVLYKISPLKRVPRKSIYVPFPLPALTLLLIRLIVEELARNSQLNNLLHKIYITIKNKKAVRFLIETAFSISLNMYIMGSGRRYILRKFTNLSYQNAFFS